MCDEIELNDESFEKILSDYPLILERACLDKYIFNPYVHQRFVKNVYENKDVLDTANNKNGSKNIFDCEYIALMSEFFDEFKLEMENEFRRRILKKVNKDKLELYFNYFCEIWPKGASARESVEISSLDASVYYFFKNRNLEPNDFVRKDFNKEISPLFSEKELIHLILVNKELIELYFNNYASFCLEKGLELAASEIWLHRGVHLSKPYKDGDKYIENRFLNSYSTSLTIVEQFSKIIPNKTPAIISGKLFDLYDRVFAFYAFMPNMNSSQQEIILIPSAKNLTTKLVHSDGILFEYEIDA